MGTGSSEVQAEAGPECTALSTGSVDSSERVGVPGAGFLRVLTQEPYAGRVSVHGPMVTFPQKRTGCGSIKADPAAIGSESTPEDASGGADRRAHGSAALPSRDGVPVRSAGFPAALITRFTLGGRRPRHPLAGGGIQ